MVPKFQAIQAAHEILGDPTQKVKYDAERAKLNRPARDTESPAPPAFKKPAPPRRTDSGYVNGNYPQSSSQPPPRRDASATRYAPQTGPRRPPSASAPGNDKFAQFARAAPQQRWDQAKFDEAARAEAYRGMNAMRGGGMPQTSPLRSRGHPTAPRPAGTSADPYSSGPEPSPGYPGLGRTASGRRFNGPGQSGDEQPSRSAYAQYHRSERDRPPSAGPYPSHEPSPHHRPHEADSPSRTPRPFPPEDFPATRPGLSRTSSRYARSGGERTNLNAGANLGRSASVRNSPIDKRWEEESGPFGAHATPEARSPRPRHRSHSPPRPGVPQFQFTSESSSDGGDSPRPENRPRANLRRPRTHDSGGTPNRPSDDGMSGYFPKTNYTNNRVDDHTYAFPAPEPKGTPLRQAASNEPPHENHDGHDRRASQDDITNPKYEIPPPFAFPKSPPKMWPPWAIPSSICPKTPRKADKLPSIPEGSSPDSPFHTPQSMQRPTRGFSFANNDRSDAQSRSPDKGDSQFSAEHWHDTLGNQPHMFSPPDSMGKDRKSPTKTSRTGRPPQRNYATTKDARRDILNDDLDPNILAGMKHVHPGEVRDKASAFQSGRLPNDFAEKVNGQRHGSKSTTSEPRPESVRTESDHANGHERPTPDEMDVDSPMPRDANSPTSSSEAHYNVTVEEEHSPAPPLDPRQHARRHESESSGLDLNGLAQSAPFVSTESGLKDLNGLGDTLPWASRPSDTLEALNRTNSATLRDLNLPRPPKAPQPLSESELDQHSWKRYGDAMTNYIHDWNKFNNAMIEHFRARQEAVTHGMYRNWVCAVGDGASADDFVASGGTDRAGYATYMTWLEDDRKCRTWWDIAFEEHRVCMEGLGKVRKRVKELGSAKG